MDLLDFDRRRHKKWLDGRRDRGLPLDAPFEGDPVLEALGETPDLANYVEQGISDGRIPEVVGREIIKQVFGIDMILGVYAEV